VDDVYRACCAYNHPERSLIVPGFRYQTHSSARNTLSVRSTTGHWVSLTLSTRPLRQAAFRVERLPDAVGRLVAPEPGQVETLTLEQLLCVSLDGLQRISAASLAAEKSMLPPHLVDVVVRTLQVALTIPMTGLPVSQTRRGGSGDSQPEYLQLVTLRRPVLP